GAGSGTGAGASAGAGAGVGADWTPAELARALHQHLSLAEDAATSCRALLAVVDETLKTARQGGFADVTDTLQRVAAELGRQVEHISEAIRGGTAAVEAFADSITAFEAEVVKRPGGAEKHGGNRRHLRSGEAAGPQRPHRSGPGGSRRRGLLRGSRGSQQAGRPQRAGDERNFGPHERYHGRAAAGGGAV